MAKIFNPSGLSAADQAAYQAWQAKSKGLMQDPNISGGLSYALVHPEYLKQHPELQEAYDLAQGVNLPDSVKSAIRQQLGNNINFDWSNASGGAGFAKHGGVWSQPETWIQLALGGALGGAGAAGAFSAAAPAAAAPTAAGSAVPASIGPVTTGLAGAGGTGTAATTAGAGGGLLGTLGKVAKVAGPISEVAGQAAGAAAKGRIDEANLLRELYNSQLLNAQQQHAAGVSDADLQLRQMQDARKAKQNAISQAYWGNVLQSMQDTSINVPEHLKSHMPTINPGFTPSMIIGKDALGKQVASQAQGVLDTPPTYQTPAGYQAPTAPTMPSAGAGGTALGYLGLIGSLLGAVGDYVPGVKKTQGA